MTLKIGQEAEQAAVVFLERAGIQILDRNYRCKSGEIDIIAKEGDTLIFVEVRQRSHRLFGNGFDSVTLRKQQKIIRAARQYLQQSRFFDLYPCRFDIVSLRSTAEIEWIRDAFQIY